MFHFFSVLCWSIVPLYLQFASAWQIGEQVKTSSGLVKGHASSWQPDVSEYLGIPYAVPPVGLLRWTPPRAFIGDGVIKAEQFGADCPTNTGSAGEMLAAMGNSNATTIFSPLLQLGHEFSEDCLTINVWTKPQTGEKAKAVLLWIYGGGFFLGSSAVPIYNGARLANENDVVVVSMNYRIGIFGFPNGPGMTDANPGLLDQRLAIEWARDNIAAFGGDPKRITIFGQSAGGMSVDMYAYAWENDPIINGIIALSGTASSGANAGAAMGTMSAGNSRYSPWYIASSKLGCGGKEAGNKTVHCMRGKSVKQIFAALDADSPIPMAGGFWPTPDARVVFADTDARGKGGKFAKVPLLVGNTDNEMGIGMGIVNLLIGMGPVNSPGSAAISAISSVFNAAGAIMSCASRDAARLRISAGVKAWRYRYFAEWPNQILASGTGAYHGGDVALVFGSAQFYTNISDVPEEIALSKNMRHAWAEFARDPQNGLLKLNWPVYDEHKPTLVRLGWHNQSLVSFASNQQYDEACNLIDNLTSLLKGAASWIGTASFVSLRAERWKGTRVA